MPEEISREDFLGVTDGFELKDIIVESRGGGDGNLEDLENFDMTVGSGGAVVGKEFGAKEGILGSFGGRGGKSYGFANLGRKSDVLGNAKKGGKKDDQLTVNAKDSANVNNVSLNSQKRILTGS